MSTAVTLRTRLTLAISAAVAVAVVLSSLILFGATRRELYAQVDGYLHERVSVLQKSQGASPQHPRAAKLPENPPSARLGESPYLQTVTSGGAVTTSTGTEVAMPVTQDVLDVASGAKPSFISTQDLDGVQLRVITAPYGPGNAVQVGRSLEEVDGVLADLRWALVFVTAGGIILAAGLGLIVARASLAPVHRLTSTAERVTRTRDLNERIDVTGDDELGRLAGSFNTMLAALDESVRAQRSLVADASHELRTPLTSVRTNVEVLLRAQELPAEDRAQLVHDIDSQIVELTALVNDLIELARGDEPVVHVDDVALDEVVDQVVTKARIHRPNLRFEVNAQPTMVRGVAERVARAVNNLVDNAGKWSPEGGTVEVAVASGTVSVRDHGPGVGDADKPHVFDRFWRAASSRAVPGSGLGLSIVRQVAVTHGGRVWVEDAPGGGALFRLQLPSVA